MVLKLIIRRDKYGDDGLIVWDATYCIYPSTNKFIIMVGRNFETHTNKQKTCAL